MTKYNSRCSPERTSTKHTTKKNQSTSQLTDIKQSIQTKIRTEKKEWYHERKDKKYQQLSALLHLMTEYEPQNVNEYDINHLQNQTEHIRGIQILACSRYVKWTEIASNRRQIAVEYIMKMVSITIICI